MVRHNPRVPLAWATAERETEEALLRKAGLHEFPTPGDKLECPSCRSKKFRVWVDRAQCFLCHLYVKLESAAQRDLRHMTLPSLTIGDDGQVYCDTCQVFSFYVYTDRLACIYCHATHALNPRLMVYWAMEPLTGPRIVPKARHPLAVKKFKED